MINTLSIIEMMNSTDGTVDAYAWPGGYPIYYLAADCEPICHACVTANMVLIVEATLEGNDNQWELIGRDINWEDSFMYCAHCNKRIDSARDEFAVYRNRSIKGIGRAANESVTILKDGEVFEEYQHESEDEQ